MFHGKISNLTYTSYLMKNKIIYLLFILCLAKVYYIADRNLKFSPALLANSFEESSGEKSSLGLIAKDLIPTKKFFLSNKIIDFKLSDEIVHKRMEIYQRMIEYNYPIKYAKNSIIFVAHKKDSVPNNCLILFSTQNLNTYECK